MQKSIAIVAAAASLAFAHDPSQPLIPTPSLAPASTPSGCATTFEDGAYFQIGLVDVSSANERRLHKRHDTDDHDHNGALRLSLSDGVLTDYNHRFGFVASSGRLQFDDDIPDDIKYSAGFSACSNGTLALESAVWWQCRNGEYYNIYDRAVQDTEGGGEECSQVYIVSAEVDSGDDDIEPSIDLLAPTETTALFPATTPNSTSSDGTDQQDNMAKSPPARPGSLLGFVAALAFLAIWL